MPNGRNVIPPSPAALSFFLVGTNSYCCFISAEKMTLEILEKGLTEHDFIKEFDVTIRSPKVPHAPNRIVDESQKRLALRNALRYIPTKYHDKLAHEFLKELDLYGHIYMYRFRPQEYEMKAYPIESYPANSRQAAGVMLMIMNNLDSRVAQYPHELVTYGGNGTVFSNWAQYRLVMMYLSKMTDNQTLTLYSGHPMGLYPSYPDAPRVVVTNGMVVPNYSSKNDYDRMYSIGVSQFGQMTAGSYCYIGPQGIVHGTTITLINAARKYLNAHDPSQVKGTVYVTAGLGGMSGAQPKAGVIADMIAVVAEIDEKALNKRFEQGWIMKRETDLNVVVEEIKRAKKAKQSLSIGWLGNIVELWERLAEEKEDLVELGSDQTSLHNPFNGGYYPVGYTFDESRELMTENPEKFKQAVQESLRRHVAAINKLTSRGMKFWDYGNAFLLQASRAGADIWNEDKTSFRYPSYFEDIMGDIFSLGFGPFRWVCTSLSHDDLKKSDAIASNILKKLISDKNLDKRVELQYLDNKKWIDSVEEHKLVVGSEARILYSNSDGRIQIALAFNDAIRDGAIKGPIMLSRDHHDVSGTDSPYRETANITDGSMFCADMAVHNFVGDAFRGATSISLHNGGGTGWGEAMNGGFLLLLDGTEEAAKRAQSMLYWDVNNGVSRRAWSGNLNAQFQIAEAMKTCPDLEVTMPYSASEKVLDTCLAAQSPRKKRQKL